MIIDFPDSKTVRKFSVFKATHPVAYCHGSRHQLTHLPRGAVQRAAGDVTGFVGASAGEEQRVPAGQSWSFCNLISDTTSITSVTSSALEVSREVRPTLKGLTGRRDPQGCLRGRLHTATWRSNSHSRCPPSTGSHAGSGAPQPVHCLTHQTARIETHFQGICGPHREGMGLRVTPSFLAWAAVSSDET